MSDDNLISDKLGGMQGMGMKPFLGVTLIKRKVTEDDSNKEKENNLDKKNDEDKSLMDKQLIDKQLIDNSNKVNLSPVKTMLTATNNKDISLTNTFKIPVLTHIPKLSPVPKSVSSSNSVKTSNTNKFNSPNHILLVSPNHNILDAVSVFSPVVNKLQANKDYIEAK